jgi:hypothetical protein
MSRKPTPAERQEALVKLRALIAKRDRQMAEDRAKLRAFVERQTDDASPLDALTPE